jgi:hypothetical protein
MKFNYCFEKNAQLLAERGLGFEEIIEEINNGNLITIKPHHNQEKYPGQKIMYVRCFRHIYLVPYITQKDDTLFLKTLFPSRKATKEFLA